MNLLKSSSVALSAAVSLLLLASCNIYKKFDLNSGENDELTRSYIEAADAQRNPEALGNLPWQAVYTDPVLANYINRALENNVDYLNAKLNVDVAHANMKGARLSYLPSVTLAPNGAGASYAHSDFSWTYQIPLAVSWEVDVFGRILNSKRSAEASYAQSKDYRQAVRSQIISGVANCYYAISSLESQLQLSRSTAEVWKENVSTMRDYKEAGRTTEAAVVQSEANYYSILAQIKDLEVSLEEANNTFSLLLNETPQMWDVPAGAFLNIPEIVREGVPMVELANRPDVRAAERAVAVAYYATNSARSAFYPSIAVSANMGFTNLLGGIIKNPAEWFTQLAGQLTMPLFARGQNIARLEATRAQQEQAMNSFRYKLLSASADVSNALTSYNKSREKAGLLAKQVDDLEKAVDYTAELFAAGSSTYLEVLTSQTGLLQAQMSFINCRLTQTQSVINVYQSLGGGGIEEE